MSISADRRTKVGSCQGLVDVFTVSTTKASGLRPATLAQLAQPARGQRRQDHRAEVVRLRTTAALAQAMLKQTAALNRSDCYYCPMAASDAGRVHRLVGRAQKSD